ncbi:MAG: hypothetical protein ACRD19_17660 [Terriglobia bacterium]
MNGSPSSEAELPDRQTCRALVERIVASSQLKRTTRLRDLLLFLGRHQLEDHLGQLHEQEIGVVIFGRAAAYDTNVDNIVRANVSELRKRIDAYFETEGCSEMLLMEIPRGGYSLVFKKREIAMPVPVETPAAFTVPQIAAPLAAAQNSGTIPRKKRDRLFAVTAVVLILALAGACAALWMRERAVQRTLDATEASLFPWRQEPTVAAFWSNFLDSNLDTDVVVPDAALSQIENYTGTTVSLHDYVNRSYLGQVQAENLRPNVRALLDSFSSLNFVTLGTIRIASNILALDPLNKKMHLYFSREYIPSFVDRDNVILLGDPTSNPFIQLIENRLNFSVERDGDHLGPVINHDPKPGEQSSYAGTDSIGYCVVAYLPNPGHNGKFLLIQGSSPAATEAAEFFLLSETQLSQFKKKLHTENFPYFEVLLKTSQVTGTPLTATVEAYRVHSEQ